MLFAVDLYRSGPVSRLTNSKSGKPVPAARPADFLNRWLLRSAQSRSLLPKLPAKVMRKETRRSIAGGYFPLLNFLHDAAKPFMTEQRKAHRVEFEMGFPANIMAIDGTWRRPRAMVSDTGARISIGGLG